MPSHEKLPSMPSHERKLSTTLMIPTMTYAEIYELRVWMVGGVWVRKWRCGDYGSSSDVSFCSFVSFSSLLFLLDYGPVQMASAWVFTACQWRWSFPVRRIRRKVAIERADQLWDLWVRTIAYVGWLFYSLIPFTSLLLYWRWQPRRSAPKEGDNVTATRDPRPGKRQCI